MDTAVARLLRRFGALLRPVAPRADRAVAAGGLRVLPAYAALARYHMSAVDLDPRLRMLAKQLAAERSRCRWCIEKGRHLWRELHLPLDTLRALPHYETSSLFSPRERAALRFAEALTRFTESDGNHGMPLAPLTAVREHLSEPEVAALTATVAEMHFFNPITGQLGADAEGRSAEPRRSAWGAPIGTTIRSLWL